MSSVRHSTRSAADADSAFAYRLKRQALGPYIKATWGWDEATQLKLHQHQFEPRETEILLVGTEPVGLCRVRRRHDEIVLVSIYVMPEWQSKGIGSAILRVLIEESQAQDLPIRLRVLRVNERARAFYAQLGFKIIETTGTHYAMRRG